MKTIPDFVFSCQDYSTRRLLLADIEAMQGLYDRCLDFMLLIDGHAADPGGVEEDFLFVPPGNSSEDKFIYGIFDRQGDLIGVLDTLRGYPEEKTWWIALLLFVPEIRSLGLGEKVLEAFAGFVRASGAQAIMLGVVEENPRAYKFWSRMGFEFVQKREPEQFGNKMHSVIVMRRNLAVSSQRSAVS